MFGNRRTTTRQITFLSLFRKCRGIIKLPYNQKIELIHPDGGSSYAISYKPQKIIEAMEGGTKPLSIIGTFQKRFRTQRYQGGISSPIHI